jgi:hypothetical protein
VHKLNLGFNEQKWPVPSCLNYTEIETLWQFSFRRSKSSQSTPSGASRNNIERHFQPEFRFCQKTIESYLCLLPFPWWTEYNDSSLLEEVGKKVQLLSSQKNEVKSQQSNSKEKRQLPKNLRYVSWQNCWTFLSFFWNYGVYLRLYGKLAFAERTNLGLNQNLTF